MKNENVLQPILDLHKFISVVKMDVSKMEHLRLAILSGQYDHNEVDPVGHTALHWAVFVQSAQVVQLLADLAVNPLQRDNSNDSTALDYACGRFENVQIAEIILERYSEDISKELLNSQDRNGETVLHYAVRFGSLEVIQFLIQKGATTLKKNIKNQLPLDLCSERDPDIRVNHILKQQIHRESLMKCSFCKQQSQIGTKRCSRCHQARYCNRTCQVKHWKEHKRECEPVVLAKANGHYISEMLEDDEVQLTPEEIQNHIVVHANHKHGNIKQTRINTIADLVAESRDFQRSIQRTLPYKLEGSASEFMAQVSVPKNHEGGPLLVKDLKKTFISFVAPSEQGYKLLVQKIQKNSSRGQKTAYFKCEFDTAFPGTVKIFASTCASSVS